jgi:hypothetical protein
MRLLKVVAVMAVCLIAAGVLLAANQNKFGVADTRIVSFDQPMLVGNVLLPKGDYQVKHTMDGDNHVMVFTQQHAKTPAEARVKCTLVPLPTKASQSVTLYTHDAANQHVLQELVFKGDQAKHVF